MASLLDALRRPAAILAFLLAGCMTALSVQARRPAGRTVAEEWILGLTGILNAGASSVRSASGTAASWFQTRVSLQAENADLKARVARLEVELWKLRNAGEEQKKILEKFSSTPPLPPATVPAHILAFESSGTFRSALLDRGESAGIKPGAIVVGMKGLLGRVVGLGASVSRVQLISDRLAAVGVVLVRTARAAVTRGDSSGRVFVQYVPTIADVAAGDAVVTSGTDGIYPKDIPVGVIEAVRGAGASIFLDLPVALAADPSRESLVFVLPPLPEAREVPSLPAAAPEPAPVPGSVPAEKGKTP